MDSGKTHIGSGEPTLYKTSPVVLLLLFTPGKNIFCRLRRSSTRTTHNRSQAAIGGCPQAQMDDADRPMTQIISLVFEE